MKRKAVADRVNKQMDEIDRQLQKIKGLLEHGV